MSRFVLSAVLAATAMSASLAHAAPPPFTVVRPNISLARPPVITPIRSLVTVRTPTRSVTVTTANSGRGGISPANAWNAGASQPYNQYSNSGISPANAWNAGASQPYNKYTNVINP